MYYKKGHDPREGTQKFVLVGVAGCHLLGILFYCHQSGAERGRLFLVFGSGKKGLQHCRNAPVFDTPGHFDRIFSSSKRGDQIDHPHGRRNDLSWGLPGDTENLGTSDDKKS